MLVKPIKLALRGIVEVAKLLTTWSVLIGVLAAITTNQVMSFNDLVQGKSFLTAIIENQSSWTWVVIWLFLTIGLSSLFAYTEWMQSKSSEATNAELLENLGKLTDIEKAINVNTDEMKKVTYAINIMSKTILSVLSINNESHNEESPTNTDDQPSD